MNSLFLCPSLAAGRGFDFLLSKECHELHRDSDGWTTIGGKIARFSAIKVCTGMQ